MVTLPQMPGFRLDGRRALVTGGSRGLGLACAAALAGQGAAVTLLARRAADLDDAVTALTRAGGTADAIVADVLDQTAVDAALSSRPAYDILVNNAGTNRPKPFLEVTADDYDTVFAVNVRAAFFIAQRVARGMVAAGLRGSIVNMSSQMGHVGWQDRTIYCASKHAVEGLTKAMAIELAPHGIRVNTLCPTFIETPLTAPYFENPAFKNAVLEKIKLGRLGTPEDIMGALVYLACDASALVTGTALRVDGGWTAG
jgi:NAD(P)-dependent dehydrogenase (short-subunit alcohol dehydrogenase family)